MKVNPDLPMAAAEAVACMAVAECVSHWQRPKTDSPGSSASGV